MIYPERLAPGDTVAIISPASVVREELIDRAAALISEKGFSPLVMPHAKGPADGSYASTIRNRAEDLIGAIENPDVKCILCARGGYGCVHLLPLISPEIVRHNPKWMIGYSDVSALHALWVKSGVVSVHGPMAKHLAEEGPDHHATELLFRLISGSPKMNYSSPPSPFNRPGFTTSTLVGGNLAVLNGLAGTPYDILGHDIDHNGSIIFIEDISEPIYAVERMIERLYLAGRLDSVRGLIFGRFTEYRPDRNFTTMEEMISALLRRHGIEGIPVAFDFPTGHVADNLPLVEGAEVKLTVTHNGAELTTHC